ncbi:hypothetical protein P4238_23465 [Pseudomonas aeruginosa]|nr:hypothetical protein [Pseudomonas aeruginosa]
MKALLDRRTDPTWMLYAAIIAWLAFSGLRPAGHRRLALPFHDAPASTFLR